MLQKFSEKLIELSAEYNVNGEIILATFGIEKYKYDKKKNELSKNNLIKALSEISTQILFNYGDNRVTFYESEGGTIQTIAHQGPLMIPMQQPNIRCGGTLYQTKENYLKMKRLHKKNIISRILSQKPDFFSPKEGLVICNESGLTNSKFMFLKKPEDMKSKEIEIGNFCGFGAEDCDFVKKYKGKLFEVEGNEFLRYIENKIDYILEEKKIKPESIYSALKDMDPGIEENRMIG